MHAARAFRKLLMVIPLVILWLGIVFGFVWLLNSVQNAGYFGFAFIALAGNLAYDGFKIVIRYEANSLAAYRDLFTEIFWFVVFFACAVISVFLAAVSVKQSLLSDQVGQIFAGVGFLLFFFLSSLAISDVEKRFRLSNLN